MDAVAVVEDGRRFRRVTALLSAIDALTLVAGWGAVLALAAIVVLLIWEMVARAFFAYSPPFAFEFSGYALGAVIALGGGEAMRAGAHVRVTILLEVVPAPVARLVDLACSVFALGLVGYVTWTVGMLASVSHARGVASWSGVATPLWIPQACIAVGLAVMTLQILARTIRLLIGEPPETPPPSALPE